MKKLATLTVLAALATFPAQAQLFIDFDNAGNQDNGPHTEPGYQSYPANHEVAADFITRSYTVNFALTGPATVSISPDWPNTTDNRVRQMIDRTPGWDNLWVGNNLDLLTDWIGVDSRTANGGNGPWDGTTGTPTYFTLTLSGLPSGLYQWTSFHHDTEKMTSDFVFDLSTDGGATFVNLGQFRMTHSGSGGVPDRGDAISGANDPDPHNLPSTVTTSFTATGDDVVIRLAPMGDGRVHTMFVGMNGFELVQVPEPSSILLVLAGGLLWGFSRRRRR